MRPFTRSSTALIVFSLSATALGLSCSNMEPEMTPTGALSLRSGTRLHHKMVTAEDGTVAALTGLYDTQLSTDCAFQVSEDGMMRCLPFGAYIQASVFLDPGCTQAFATSSKCLPAMKYVVDYSSLTCGMLNRVLNVLEFAAPPATIYYKSATACTQIPNSYSVYRMYSLGTPAPASTFVGGMEMN
jgi:hypothetical protein